MRKPSAGTITDPSHLPPDVPDISKTRCIGIGNVTKVETGGLNPLCRPPGAGHPRKNRLPHRPGGASDRHPSRPQQDQAIKPKRKTAAKEALERASSRFIRRQDALCAHSSWYVNLNRRISGSRWPRTRSGCAAVSSR